MNEQPEKEGTSRARRDLFAYLGERLMARAEQQPITITIQFADGVRTFEVKPGDPWYKSLAARRGAALRSSFGQPRASRELRIGPPVR
jgi:hypothetical protein